MSSWTQQIVVDVLLMSFPWRTLGIDFRRNVTLLRLSSGRVVVHSTAKFEETTSPRSAGSASRPGWSTRRNARHVCKGRARAVARHSLSDPERLYEEERCAGRTVVAAAGHLDGGDRLAKDRRRAYERARTFSSAFAHVGRGRSLLFVSGRNTQMATLLRAALHAVAAAFRDQLVLSSANDRR